MPRPKNPQCRACAGLDATAARTKPCWAGDPCHKRRTYYRRLVEREQNSQETTQAAASEAGIPLTIHVPLPSIYYALLYRYITSNGGLHAVASELYLGEKPIARTPAQHVGALTNEILRQYLSNILAAYSQQCGRTIALFRDQVDLPLPRYGCPIPHCPSHKSSAD